jgi:hypothetical protein
MSFRKQALTHLRTLLVCMVLEFGSVIGIPMRPDEIARLMRTMSHPKLAHVLPDATENGNGDYIAEEAGEQSGGHGDDDLYRG